VNINYEKPLNYFSAPLELRQIYNETYTALSEDAKKLASIGMRTIIETICALNEITDKVAHSLPGKIKVLRKQEVISPNMKDVLLNIKDFGDQGAHTLRMPKDAELELAWNAINILISATYGTEDSRNDTAKLSGSKSIRDENKPIF
jgi:hypothetical protein